MAVLESGVSQHPIGTKERSRSTKEKTSGLFPCLGLIKAHWRANLFALSVDYDKTDQATQTFFAAVQNLLLYAVTQQTAAELITARANPDDRHFGLLHWQGDKVRKQDILIAKNYLTVDEIDTLNRLVVIFLETAELRTKRRDEVKAAILDAQAKGKLNEALLDELILRNWPRGEKVVSKDIKIRTFIGQETMRNQLASA